MNNVEFLEQLIDKYNTEQMLATKSHINKNVVGMNRYIHGAYILALLVDQVANSLDLEIERFDKEAELINKYHDYVKRNVSQIRIKNNSQR